MTDNKLTNKAVAQPSRQLRSLAGWLVLSLLSLGVVPRAIAVAEATPTAGSHSRAKQASGHHSGKVPTRLSSYYSTLQNHETEGPYHQNSSEVLYSLGLALQKDGQHGKALKALRRSMHINRVNSGLNSLSQAPMLRGIIHSQKKLMQLAPVTTSYHRLLRMHMASYGKHDPRIAPLLNELALWHIDAYQLDEGSRRIDHLTSANSLNTAALQLNQEQMPARPREQIKLLRSAALISFHLSRHEGDEWSASTDSHFSLSANGFATTNPQRAGILTGAGFRRGEICHKRIVALTASIPEATLQDKLQAQTELADWYWLFSRRKESMIHYREVLAKIAASEQADSLYAELFSTPQLLPALRMENQKDAADTLFMTANVDISEKGWGSRIENIEDTLFPEPGPASKKNLRYLLIDNIKGSRFRPLFVDNEPAFVKNVKFKIPLMH